MTQPARSWHQKKLSNTKWTALAPQQREKHFIVVKVELNPNDVQKVGQITLSAHAKVFLCFTLVKPCFS